MAPTTRYTCLKKDAFFALANGWISFNHKRCRNVTAISSPWCDPVMGWSPPGSAGVPPAQHWHCLGHLLGAARPATAPGLCLGRSHAVPGGRVAGCPFAGKLSGTQRQRMRAGRPRSRVGCLLPSLLLLEGACAGSPGRSPADVAESSRFVALGGSLFFRLFHMEPAPLPLAPLELAPQNVEKAVAGRLDQLDRAGGLADLNAVVSLQVQAGLSVHGQKYRLLGGFQTQFDGRRNRAQPANGRSGCARQWELPASPPGWDREWDRRRKGYRRSTR